MRETEFRGKDIKTGKWVYGDLTKPKDANYALIWERGSEAGTPVDSETVGEYIGLKGKHGIKIFEGDLIKRLTMFGYDAIHKVFFNSAKGAFDIEVIVGLPERWLYSDEETIVGNIYDNQELIKDAQHKKRAVFVGHRLFSITA